MPITQQALVPMFVKFQARLVNSFDAQTFEGFNELCTKAHDIELQLNKRKKSVKESANVENIIATTVHNKTSPTITLGVWSSKGLDTRTKMK